MNIKNKIVYFGLNEFGEYALQVLLTNNLNICAVVITNNNRTKGFEQICLKKKIKLIVLNEDYNKLLEEIKELKPDILVIASFSKILPKTIINYPRLGAINVHPSLLPKYRGAHPIHWALINNESVTGVTIHTVEEKADTGKILAQKEVAITNNDDINSLITKLSKEGASLLAQTVINIFNNPNSIRGVEQNEKNITYAPKRKPEDGKINWKDNTRSIFNLVRSLKDPYPNAFSHSETKEEIKFSHYVPDQQGLVLSKIQGHYLITTGDGVILLKTSKRLKIGEILK